MVYAVSAELPLYIRRADCNVPLSFHPGSRHGKRDFILLVTFRIYADFSRMKACLYQPFIILHVKMPIPIRSGQQSVAQNLTIHTKTIQTTQKQQYRATNRPQCDLFRWRLDIKHFRPGKTFLSYPIHAGCGIRAHDLPVTLWRLS